MEGLGLGGYGARASWHRFPSARAFMGYSGLVPSEYSSGTRARRGSITKAGPAGVLAALAGPAHSCRLRPAIGARLRGRQDGLPPDTLARSWKARQRLHATWKKMAARGRPCGVTVTAAARELAGFVWAEMTSWPHDEASAETGGVPGGDAAAGRDPRKGHEGAGPRC